MKQIAAYSAKKLFTAKLSLIFTSAFLLFLFGQQVHAQTCSPAPVGLVSWWSGDNNSLDSRSRNNGTLVNGATYASGQNGQAFSLDGITQYVSAPASSSLDVGSSPNGMTIEGWIRPINLSSARPIAEWSTTGSSAGSVGVHLYASVNPMMSGQGNLYVNFRVGNQDKVIYSPTNALTVNTFQHVAAAYDRATGNASLYINGTAVTLNGGPSTTVNLGNFNPNTSGNLYFGARVSNENGDAGTRFAGLLDEVDVFNRVLSAAEIQAIVTAGTAGKCKPTATVSPGGQVGWWSGDGNANDTAGTNNGVLTNGASYIVGKVGQGFRLDGFDDYVDVSAMANNSQNFTIESWIRRGSSTVVTNNPLLTSPGGTIFASSFNGVAFLLDQPTNKLGLSKIGVSSVNSNSLTITDTNWHHIAVTKSGSSVTFYLDGVADTVTYNETFQFNSHAAIGRRVDFGANEFFGDVDELSQYSVPLTQDEITSIFNAGIAGKLKDNTTAAGANIAVSTKSDGTVTFQTVTTAGITQQIPLDMSLFPALPLGSTSTGLNYDIATSAVYSGSPTVCFNLSSVTNPTAFNILRILHLESNVWVNRTNLASINFSTKTICTDSGLTSLSPFAVVNGFGPTAASASIRGRVSSKGGRGIMNVSMTLTNTTTDEIKFSRSTSFGYFSFRDLEVGNTYVLTLSSKRYSFANPTRVISLAEDLTDVDFVALP